LKKEIVALGLLILIVAGNIWNQHRLTGLAAELDSLVKESCANALDGRWTRAEEAAEKAEQRWREARRYTHIFIRHTDVDALTAAFCALRGAIAGQDEGELMSSCLLLQSGLRSLLDMEKLSAGSIF
jgi:hypothetical protein